MFCGARAVLRGNAASADAEANRLRHPLPPTL